MSERITGAELSALLLEIPANPERFYGSELVLCMAEELFDLRAEVERLRVVEQAHHKNYALCTRCYGLGITTLPDGKHSQVCPLCSGCGYIVHRTALDATKS